PARPPPLPSPTLFRSARPSPVLTCTLRSKENIMALTIVTGSDNAGHGHKSALKELLEQDPRVAKVIDVGVAGREDNELYPNIAVAAAEKVAAGEADQIGRAVV